MTFRLILTWTQRALFAGAAILLGLLRIRKQDTWMYQHRAACANADAPAERGARLTCVVGGISPLPPPVGPDGLIGRIEVQRLGVSVVVAEGTEKPTLRHAAGHIVGTGFPGAIGNIGIAAHRDTFFRPLRNIQRDDIITLTTLRGEYRYKVVSTKIVDPYDVAVLNPDGTEILTLVTCYPFYFVGSAPNRFIVRAARVI